MCETGGNKILLIEPFYAGSHKVLIDLLEVELKNLGFEFEVVTMKGKKWHWRARTSALHLSFAIPIKKYDILFTSSVLPLAQLLGLRPDLQSCRKIIYFHENQLNYPQRSPKERDFQYAFNDITSALAADEVIFNSNYNRTSFLDSISPSLKIMPDYRPKNISAMIEPKSRVIHFPITLPCTDLTTSKENVLHILWPHRWEFDKDPESFFQVLFRLQEENLEFRAHFLGETFEDVPPVFENGKEKLGHLIATFGPLEKSEYLKLLKKAHVVVSTSQHEFFGVSIAEAVLSGCYPLLPNRLVYPELYPPETLYSNNDDLFNKLKAFASDPSSVPMPPLISNLLWDNLKEIWTSLFSAQINKNIN